MSQDANYDRDHGSEVSEMQHRVKALKTVLIEKGPVNLEALYNCVHTMLLLPLRSTWSTSGLVQVDRLPFSRS